MEPTRTSTTTTRIPALGEDYRAENFDLLFAVQDDAPHQEK